MVKTFDIPGKMYKKYNMEYGNLVIYRISSVSSARKGVVVSHKEFSGAQRRYEDEYIFLRVGGRVSAISKDDMHRISKISTKITITTGKEE